MDPPHHFQRAPAISELLQHLLIVCIHQSIITACQITAHARRSFDSYCQSMRNATEDGA
jgi:hypothetical protein